MNCLQIIALCLTASMLTGNDSMQKSQFAQVKKIFHHRSDGKYSLDCAKIVFYFDHEPLIKKESQVIKTKQIDRYFFPMAAQDDAIKPLVDRFNSLASQYYKARVELRDKPTPGMALEIEYNPKKIAVHYDFFDAITRDKGVIFHITNLEVLQALKNKNHPVLRTVHAKKPGIIIDCGHGGTDSGTIGFFGTKEKDVTLTVGMHLVTLLKDQGFPVYCTRQTDIFVPLDERTTHANFYSGDLFISLHANHSPSSATSGIETYCLDMGLFTSGHALNDLIYASYTRGLCHKSQLLAQSVHQGLLEELTKNGNNVVDRHVKNAVSQVLVGTCMPSTLIEIGYLSNELEAARLKESSYQKLVAQGICQGITRYCNQLS